MCIMQSVCENATAKRHLLKVRFGFISIQFFFGFCFRNERVHQQRQEAKGARSIEPYGSIYCNIVWCCCTGLHPPTHEVAMHIIIIMVESVFGCACGPICAAHVRESMPTRMLWIIIVRAYRGGRRWSSRVCVCVCVWCTRIYYHQCHTATCAFVDRNHHVITPVFLYIFFNALRFFYMHLNRVACSIVFSSVSLFYIPSFFLSFNYDFSNTIYGCLAASCACDSQSICLLNKTHFANNRLMALRKLYVFTNLIFGFRLI